MGESKEKTRPTVRNLMDGSQGGKPYRAVPHDDPTSTSHRLGTLNGTAFCMISATYFASFLSITEMAISSWICIKGIRPLSYILTIDCLVMSAADA